jgi:transcriptional regulator with XRE-family HTH domain
VAYFARSFNDQGMRLGRNEQNGAELAAIGAAIRARRRLVGVSQEELAYLADIDRSHMGKIERGERNVSLLNLIRISRALQTQASEILTAAGC